MKSILLGLSLLLASSAALALDKPMPGDQAPSIDARRLDGNPLSLADYRGQPVSLVFLDSLCPMPHFPQCAQKIARANQLAAANPEHPWIGVVKGFYVDEAYVRDFAERFKLNFPLVWDKDNKIFSDYQVYGTPYQVWLDPQGRLSYRGERIEPLHALH
ncbi:peroxiredoxin family protein [Marinobacterium arenosum]|uniref:peroxiredoxin family protein n=1 Tax=Marinobacterium arenosum TaxID=2862496 RepID=UPI001C9713C2|nr:redoxin domain-containing protein [Marinobacterium arenosum]MBY4677749.1 peroxiredoxin family protein [Marinobacterium arenosum]